MDDTPAIVMLFGRVLTVASLVFYTSVIAAVILAGEINPLVALWFGGIIIIAVAQTTK